MTTEYNPNFVCVMCDKKNESGNGSIKNNKFICMDCVISIKNTQVPPIAPIAPLHVSPPPVVYDLSTKAVIADPKQEDVPRYSPNPDGTCTYCKKNYGYCKDSVIKNGNWFCGKTCSRIYLVACNPLPQQINGWPFQSSLETVRPIHVGQGFMLF
jgi:hypothetical protein